MVGEGVRIGGGGCCSKLDDACCITVSLLGLENVIV